VAVPFNLGFLPVFRGFVGGAIFVHFYYLGKRRNRRRDAALEDTALAPARGSSFAYPIAINGVAKCIEISNPTVSRLKSEALKAGFIKRKSNNQKLHINPDFYSMCCKASKDCEGHFVRKNSVYRKYPDLIWTNLVRCFRRH